MVNISVVVGGVLQFNNTPADSICSFVVEDDDSAIVSSYCGSDDGR